MKRSDRGSKHLCADCAIKYYDMGKAPACPKCGAAPVPVPTTAQLRAAARRKTP